jgi:hypothetical protein
VYTRGAVSRTVAPDEPVAASATIAWCASGLEPIAGGGCWSAPKTENPPVVIYLHGRYDEPATPQEMERQARVARRANARGFAVVAFRSPKGACGHAELASWYCWPSNPDTANVGPAVVAGWGSALAEINHRTTNPKRFVMGFSSGAYFASIVAIRNLLPADAVAIVHGGAGEIVRRTAKPTPLFVLGAYDDVVTMADILKLDASLNGVAWPHDSYARPGGHFLTDGDIDASLTFFERAPRERVPLKPPLPLDRPRLIVRAEGGDAAAPDTSGASFDASAAPAPATTAVPSASTTSSSTSIRGSSTPPPPPPANTMAGGGGASE